MASLTCLGEPQKASQRIYKVTLDLTFKEKSAGLDRRLVGRLFQAEGAAEAKKLEVQDCTQNQRITVCGLCLLVSK